MTAQTKHIFEQAKSLSPIERAELIEQLFSTFDFPEREVVDAKWAKEAESRIDAYERGELESVPEEEVFARLQSKAAK